MKLIQPRASRLPGGRSECWLLRPTRSAAAEQHDEAAEAQQRDHQRSQSPHQQRTQGRISPPIT
jgi:hypothetical protein